jgi:elongation factor P
MPLLPPSIAPIRHPKLRMGVVEPSKFKKGLTIEMDDAIWKIMDFQQSKTARQAAVVRTKLKNLMSGTTAEKTFRLKDSVATAELEKRPATYSYEDDGEYVLYDTDTSDELRVKTDSVVNGDLMPPGMDVVVRQWRDFVVDVEMPSSVELMVTDTVPGDAGDRATPGKKPAELETGATVQVPLFVDTDERIIVNTETREYVGRAN